MPKYTAENTFEIGKPANVFLDGIEMRYCSEADTDEGYVIVAKLDSNGQMYAEGDEIATERLTGVVAVEFI